MLFLSEATGHTQKFCLGMRLHTRCICCPTAHLGKRQEIVIKSARNLYANPYNQFQVCWRGVWKSRKCKWNGNWKQNLDVIMETEMKMQPLSCCMWGYSLATALLTWPNNIIQRISQGDRILRTGFTEIATEIATDKAMPIVQLCHTAVLARFACCWFSFLGIQSLYVAFSFWSLVPKLSYIALWQCCVAAPWLDKWYSTRC